MIRDITVCGVEAITLLIWLVALTPSGCHFPSSWAELQPKRLQLMLALLLWLAVIVLV